MVSGGNEGHEGKGGGPGGTPTRRGDERHEGKRRGRVESISKNSEGVVGGGTQFEEMEVNRVEEVDSEDNFLPLAEGGTKNIFEGT